MPASRSSSGISTSNRSRDGMRPGNRPFPTNVASELSLTTTALAARRWSPRGHLRRRGASAESGTAPPHRPSGRFRFRRAACRGACVWNFRSRNGRPTDKSPARPDEPEARIENPARRNAAAGTDRGPSARPASRGRGNPEFRSGESLPRAISHAAASPNDGRPRWAPRLPTLRPLCPARQTAGSYSKKANKGPAITAWACSAL